MRSNFGWILLVITFHFIGCVSSETPMNMDQETLKIPDISLKNWKVTLPIGNPTEVKPPEILAYANNSTLKDYMFNDTKEGALVLYTEPGNSTANSSYSRTELREQMIAGSDNTNWTFEQGGSMKGTLRLSRVSGKQNNLDRVIIMQIHGRLTDDQRDMIGQDDNNAPPVLKIYWDDGRLNVRRKVLKSLSISEIDLLKKDSWKDESHWFDGTVSTNSFTLEVNVEGSTLQVTLNNGEESMTFDDIHTKKWGVFENYFKAGNYLQSKEVGAFSEVKYYELTVAH